MDRWHAKTSPNVPQSGAGRAIGFLENSDDVKGSAQIDASIADLRKVKKKKSRVKKLINKLKGIP